MFLQRFEHGPKPLPGYRRCGLNLKHIALRFNIGFRLEVAHLNGDLASAPLERFDHLIDADLFPGDAGHPASFSTESNHRCLTIAADDFDDIVDIVPVETSGRRYKNVVLLSDLDIVDAEHPPCL